MPARRADYPRPGVPKPHPHRPDRSFRGKPSGATPSRRPPPLGDAARDLALRAIARQCRRFPDLDLKALETAFADAQAVGAPPLDARDRAFVFALVDAVQRRWLTLEWILRLHLNQPPAELEARVRAVLLAGAAQILLFDKVPPHAAINHAVEWAKLTVRPGAGGLVNAVLRKVAALKGDAPARPTWTNARDELPTSDGTAVVLAEACLPEDALERTFVACGVPGTLSGRWLQERGERETRRLVVGTLINPPVIINAAHAERALEPSPLLVAHESPGHWVFTGSHAELVELLDARKDVWVQDPSSSAAVLGLSHLKPRVVADLCAGQGTKTRQLRAVFPEAEIYATDVDDARVRTLRSVFEGDARVTVLGHREAREKLLGKVDLVLLDVPCSNTGVLARRPEAKYRVDAEHLASLTQIQRQAIADAIPLLCERPAGRIAYATCSLEKCENDDQAAWAGKWHGFHAVRPATRLPMGEPGSPATGVCDGSYSVLLERK